MPEGDTLHKLARALDRGLAGRVVESVRLPEHPGLDLTGRRIAAARAHGKHLWIEFAAEGRHPAGVLRSHLGMHGSWHRYDPGEPWLEPRRRVSLELHAGGSVWVLFAAAELEWMAGDRAADRSLRGRLGPDLVEGVAEPGELHSRAAALVGPDALLLDVLLDQRVASGLGNVYKSELLFLFELGVRTRLPQVKPERLHAIYAKGSELLRANLGPGARVTRRVDDGRGPLWVYRRAGKPCLRCGAPVEQGELGRRRRSTYWCPSCQA